MKNKEAIRYLEYLTRHGLYNDVLSSYKKCGMLYYSKEENMLDTSVAPLTDIHGISNQLILDIDDIEAELDIIPYHIIIRENEVLIMYCTDNEDKDYNDYKFNEFRHKRINVIAYYPNDGYWLYKNIKYDVQAGGIRFMEEIKNDLS